MPSTRYGHSEVIYTVRPFWCYLHVHDTTVLKLSTKDFDGVHHWRSYLHATFHSDVIYIVPPSDVIFKVRPSDVINMVPLFWCHQHGTTLLMSSTWYHFSDVINMVRHFWFHLHGTTLLMSSTWYDPSDVIYMVPLFWCHQLGTTLLMSSTWYHSSDVIYMVKTFLV